MLLMGLIHHKILAEWMCREIYPIVRNINPHRTGIRIVTGLVLIKVCRVWIPNTFSSTDLAKSTELPKDLTSADIEVRSTVLLQKYGQFWVHIEIMQMESDIASCISHAAFGSRVLVELIPFLTFLWSALNAFS